MPAPRAVLFDLGNTLVRYWTREEFPAVLREATDAVRDLLADQGRLTAEAEAIRTRVAAQDHGSPDARVDPLERRLAAVFELTDDPDGGAARPHEALCRAFMGPIFAWARPYQDAVPALRSLRRAGVGTAVVSNSPWGSPAYLWHEELERLGLATHLDAAVFCGEVGWRKPAPPIFERALDALRLRPEQCLFVGDDPRWDVAGPQAVGMRAVLIAREGIPPETSAPAIRSLAELPDLMDPETEG